MHVIARAPNRVDLAGGSLDLYPIYLLMGGGLTVSAAITIASRVDVQARTDTRVIIRSSDRNETVQATSLASLAAGGPLGLIAKVILHARPTTGIEVTTHNEAPAGSGLGASSALATALYAALSVISGQPYSRSSLVQIAAELEAQVLEVPTGRQDHYAAATGGINAFWFDAGSDRIEPLDPTGALAADLNQRMVVAYTGRSRISAQINWEIVRRFIDKDPATRKAMTGILEAAHGVRQALLSGPDWDTVAGWVNQDWQSRKQLSPAVSSPQLDRLLAAATDAGAMAAKLCGAGGGGCLLALVPPGRRDQVVTVLRRQGAVPLPAGVATEGLSVSVSVPTRN